MKTITVAQLRQNPTAALDEVEHGETYIVTKHRREVARLVPPAARRGVTPDEFEDLLRRTPLTEDWAAEIAEQRSDFDTPDPWERYG